MNRRDHDLAIVALHRRKHPRVESLKRGEVFDQLAPISLMSGERKVFKLMIVLVKADTRCLRRVRLEVVFEISVDQFMKRTRLRVD